ncbi:MAG: FAD-dependent oxidoreductase [Ilumatobacteraceae bacterium]
MTLNPDPFDVDVVVIGAGFAGLAAATELARHGVSFVIVEARDRIGGKAEAQADDTGRLVDTGCQFANDDMTEVLALAASAGATVVNSDHPGHPVTVPGGAAGDPWSQAEAALEQLGGADLHDARSIDQWAASLDVAPAVRDAVRSAVNGATCHDSRSIPVSYAAQLNERTPTTHPELQRWFAETMHSLAQHLATPLAGSIRLGSAVRAVHLHDESVDVVALDQVWHARHVLCAVPPSAYQGLGFTPSLPDDIATAASAFAPGTVLKYLLRYDEPFWLADGRNGIGQFLTPAGVYFADASTPDAARLVGFVGGTTATEWARHDEADRRAAVLHHAAEAFGPRAAAPRALIERLWAPDELGGGGYSNVMVRHDPGAADALAVGLPLVTFASTELALRFPGYVEGALHAGRAGAAQALRRLRLT